MGLGRSLDLCGIKKVVGGGVQTHDQIVYCNTQWTSGKRKQLIKASIWERTPGNYRLFSARRAGETARVDVAMFSSLLWSHRSLHIRLLFLAERMTGCMCKIVLIRLLATLFHRLDGVE